jgi:hypothetical protein
MYLLCAGGHLVPPGDSFVGRHDVDPVCALPCLSRLVRRVILGVVSAIPLSSLSGLSLSGQVMFSVGVTVACLAPLLV